MAPQELSDLQVKYYDWCSARISEYLSKLPSDEVQPLLERAPKALLPLPLELVATRHPLADRLIRTAFQKLALPSFAAWAEEYERNPAQYEKELLGFRSPAAAHPVPSA